MEASQDDGFELQCFAVVHIQIFDNATCVLAQAAHQPPATPPLDALEIKQILDSTQECEVALWQFAVAHWD